MSDERIDPKVIEVASAAHRSVRYQLSYFGATEYRGPSAMEAAIRAADRERGLKEERITHFIEEDYENESGRWVDGGRARLVSDYYDSPRQGQVERGEATAERRGVCGRIMVGSGTDTYDPVCELPNGHDEMCRSSSAIDQHRLGRPVGRGGEDG